MSVIPENIRRRIEAQGLFLTLYYAFFVVLLPRLGLTIKKVYYQNAIIDETESGTDTDFNITILHKYEQLTKDIIDSMLEFEGNSLLERIKIDFNSKSVCVLGKDKSDTFVGLCWLQKINAINDTPFTYLLRDSFVLPDFRGRGYYMKLKLAACSYVRKASKNEKFLIVGNVILGNISSARCQKKAGFSHVRTDVYLLGKLVLNIPTFNKI